MGYHVNIVRTENGKEIPFSISELEQAVCASHGWKFESDKEQASFYKDDNHIVTVWWTKGEIWTKNPEEDALAAMIQLANVLKARVRGDEFETYRSPQDWYIHPDDTAKKAKSEDLGKEIVRRARRRSRIMRIIIFSTFAILVMLASYFDNN